MQVNVLKKLSDGDLRTIGRVEEVVKEILENTQLFNELFVGLEHKSPGVRMRSADAMEKVLKLKPELLSNKKYLIDIASRAEQQEVQWHMAQVFTYIPLTNIEIQKIYNIMLNYYKISKSNIVRTFALTTLSHLATLDPSLKKDILVLINDAIDKGASSVKARAKKLKLLLS